MGKIKFSVCTDALYNGLDTAEAISRCAALGFEAIEFWFWPDKDMKAIKEAATKNNVRIAGFCTSHMRLTEPSERSAFLDGLAESVRVAQSAGAGLLITQTGPDTGEPRETQLASLIDGLSAAKRVLDGSGVVLVVEPLNVLYDHPGYFLPSSIEGFEIIKKAGHPNIKILYDIYHQQITEGNIVNNIRGNIGLIAHFHAAGHPGRHELSEGELDYGYVLAQIEKMPYGGYVGLEYFPVNPPEVGLKALA